MAISPSYDIENLATRFGKKGLIEALLSIKCKATILVVGVTLAIAAASIGYLLRTSAGLFRAQCNEELEHLGAMLSRAAAATLGVEDLVALQTLIDEATDGIPLQYAVILDPQGRVLASAWNQDGSPSIADIALRPHESDVPGRSHLLTTPGGNVSYLDVTYPISSHSPHGSNGNSPAVLLNGYVRAGMLANSWERAISSQLDILVGVGMVIILLAIPSGFIVIRRIITPLERLSAIMHQFSQGKLDVRATGGRRDEIGRLSTAFNRMADQHQHTHQRIVELNAELEQRVAQRTRQLRELAAREPLTGLYNRRHFNEMLDRCLAEAARHDNDLACIMIDLDDFKAVNDAFGHRVGDEVLILAADTIRGALRLSDVPARYGGDEFIILLPRTDGHQAHALGERIVEAFARRLAVAIPQAQTRISIGIASISGMPSPDAESLVRAADRALYDAKDAGRAVLTTSTPSTGPS